jgi:hypothetical protein
MITVIGFGSEGVFSYAIERFKLWGELKVVDLESFIYDTSATVMYDGRRLKLCGEKSCAIPVGMPIYHRVFSRRENILGAQERLRTFYNALVAYSLDQRPGCLLINHPLASAANVSKAAQLRMLSIIGFKTPTTLVTTNRAQLLSFCEDFPSPISKGAGGVRTIAGRVCPDAFNADAKPQPWPVLLQQYIGGFDVRLHCVGLRSIGLRISTDYTDYRYAERNGFPIKVEPIAAPPYILEKCWRYMRAEKQEFAAFDFRVSGSDWYLLEVNPMPGFSFFDRLCDGRISEALWQLLSQGYSNLFRPSREEGFIPTDRRPQVDIGNPLVAN